MAGRGPKPSTNARRRNKHPEEELEGKKPSFEPPKLFKRASYCTATQEWWDDWATSDQAEAFWATDWRRLQQLAPMVEAYHQGELKWLAEIRLNEALLGATVADRQRLRMAPKKDDDKPQELPDDVPSIDKYRQAFGESA